LSKIVGAWFKLPQVVKAGILAMVEASGGGERERLEQFETAGVLPLISRESAPKD
jgi:hypothetical protein